VSDEPRGRDEVTREYDPEEKWPDPERDLPDIPDPPSPPPGAEPSPAVRSAFWKAVIVVNYAVLAVCLGPMLAYFRGWVLLGAGVFASGLLAFGYAVLIYRGFRRRGRDDAPGNPKE
jgi:hypothetical protein